jgi:hypothetical protein
MSAISAEQFPTFQPGRGALPLLEGLFLRARANMTPGELRELAIAGPEVAESMAANLAAAARNAAGDAKASAAPELLYGLADMAEHIEALLKVGELARSELSKVRPSADCLTTGPGEQIAYS